MSKKQIYLFYYCDSHRTKSSFRLEFASSNLKRFKNKLINEGITIDSCVNIKTLPDDYNLKGLNNFITYGFIDIIDNA